jgi:hypothetical protein
VTEAELEEVYARHAEAAEDAADWHARAVAAEVEALELRSRLETSRFFLAGLHPETSEAQFTEALSRGASVMGSPHVSMVGDNLNAVLPNTPTLPTV